MHGMHSDPLRAVTDDDPEPIADQLLGRSVCNRRISRFLAEGVTRGEAIYSVAIHVMLYDHLCIHQTFPCSRTAMAGATKKLLELADLVKVLEGRGGYENS